VYDLGKWTEGEIRGLLNLMDAGVRALGLKAAKDAALLSFKIEQVLANGADKPLKEGE
jgi:hypothetical protein